MGETGVEYVRKFQEKSHTKRKSENGKEFSQKTATKKPDEPAYEIKWDNTGQFRCGQKITTLKYNLVKKGYGIRILDWVGDSWGGLGKEVFYISGLKRELIKDFLDERKYVITIQDDQYIVTGNGKKVAPMAISLKIQEMKNVKFLWIHVIGETCSDRTSIE